MNLQQEIKTSGYRRVQPSEQNACSLTVPSFVARDGELKRRSYLLGIANLPGLLKCIAIFRGSWGRA